MLNTFYFFCIRHNYDKYNLSNREFFCRIFRFGFVCLSICTAKESNEIVNYNVAYRFVSSFLIFLTSLTLCLFCEAFHDSFWFCSFASGSMQKFMKQNEKTENEKFGEKIEHRHFQLCDSYNIFRKFIIITIINIILVLFYQFFFLFCFVFKYIILFGFFIFYSLIFHIKYLRTHEMVTVLCRFIQQKNSLKIVTIYQYIFIFSSLIIFCVSFLRVFRLFCFFQNCLKIPFCSKTILFFFFVCVCKCLCQCVNLYFSFSPFLSFCIQLSLSHSVSVCI